MNRGRSRAHPRSRGENPCQRGPEPYPGGSSPLTRGKRRLRRRRASRRRLIPAHAGKTTAKKSSCLTATAHPRSRGENATFAASMMALIGSSPLTRGKPGTRMTAPTLSWLIPAHAGKTTRVVTATARRRAHPRSRGENSDPAYGRALSMGSSPLTRGKPRKGRARCPRRRLIPAHAGKTQRTARCCGGSRAHPRSRGENALISVMVGIAMGSSPLTRGKLRLVLSPSVLSGLIPAHAGKTAISLSLAI